jgi:hypothetical protein
MGAATIDEKTLLKKTPMCTPEAMREGLLLYKRIPPVRF